MNGGATMRTRAKFPAVKPQAGHYESFYIKAADPAGGRAVWLRHTAHQRPGQPPTASLWLTWFDAAAPGPRAVKHTVGAEELSTPTGAYIKVGDAVLEPGRAHGSITGEALTASWDLRFEDRHEAFRHLPFERLYTAPFPRTKLLSPHPGARFSGTVELGGESIELDRWPGMVGHNWGAEHAERWVWLHGADLGGREGDYLDIAAGRIKIGPLMTPWIANGMLVLAGREYRLGGPARIRGTEIDAVTGRCRFTLPGKGINVTGEASAPAKDFVAWIYADPKGPEHNTINCSIADLAITVERPGKRPTHVGVTGGAAYELGMRESDHGVPLQPYGDG